jgi:hypothetical protein
MSSSYVTCLTHIIHEPKEGQLFSVIQDTSAAARGFSSYAILLYSGPKAHSNKHHHSTCQTRKHMCSSPPEWIPNNAREIHSHMNVTSDILSVKHCLQSPAVAAVKRVVLSIFNRWTYQTIQSTQLSFYYKKISVFTNSYVFQPKKSPSSKNYTIYQRKVNRHLFSWARDLILTKYFLLLQFVTRYKLDLTWPELYTL